MTDNVTPIGNAPSLRGDGAFAAPSPDDRHDLDDHDDAEANYQLALRILGARAMASGGLHKRLQQKGLTLDAAQAAVDRVAAAGYLDDASFAQLRIERLRERGQYGDRAIRQRLVQDGVPASIIDEVLAASELDDPEQLVLEAARDRASRLRGLDRETAERRLSSYLQRRGHAGSVIRQAVRQALDEAGDAAT